MQPKKALEKLKESNTKLNGHDLVAEAFEN